MDGEGRFCQSVAALETSCVDSLSSETATYETVIMLDFDAYSSALASAVSPLRELGAYEALWAREKMSFKTMSGMSTAEGARRLSDLVPPEEAREFALMALQSVNDGSVARFGVRVKCDGAYPEQLLAAEYPVPVLYYSGHWDLVHTPCVAIVGTRNPSLEGVARARRLARSLVADGYTVVSGMARGIDTAAHRAAIEAGGRTIAVLGTALNVSYPPENSELQDYLAEKHLLISQVPFVRYSRQTAYLNRLFFPERNVTMSALTMATIIVEAGETSGTLVQARAALKQGRKLFILDSCFRNTSITWPAKYEARGAVRVSEYGDIKKLLDGTRKEDFADR